MITLQPRRGMAEGAEGWRTLGLSRLGLERFAKRAREAVGLRGDVDVLLTTDAVLKRLNREFRGKDKATDVLSFPAPEEIAADHAGDLAISLQTAARQAKKFRHGLDTEVRVLLLHGFLHLGGMDHETDRGEMAAREAELREKLGIPAGLIERVEEAGSRKQEAGSREQGTGSRKARRASEGVRDLQPTSRGGAKTRVRRSGPEAPSLSQGRMGRTHARRAKAVAR